MDRLVRSCLQLGFNNLADVVRYVPLDDHEAMAAVLEMVKRSRMTNRHVQLLQTMRASSIAEITKFEWIFCRLFLNDISEVLEYIEFSKQLDGYPGLDEIYDLLHEVETKNQANSGLRQLRFNDIILMHRRSQKRFSKDHLMFKDLYQMQEISISIQSQFFDH